MEPFEKKSKVQRQLYTFHVRIMREIQIQQRHAFFGHPNPRSTHWIKLWKTLWRLRINWRSLSFIDDEIQLSLPSYDWPNWNGYGKILLKINVFRYWVPNLDKHQLLNTRKHDLLLTLQPTWIINGKKNEFRLRQRKRL